MRSDYGPSEQLGLAKPGPALKGVLGTLFVIWVVFALALNWGGASEQLFLLFVGNPEAIVEGQLWRLVTPLFMHLPTGGIGHILMTLLGLYFLGHSLEEAWGARRFLSFLFWSGVLAYFVQFLAALVLPAYFRERLVPQEWFGAMPVVDAVAIAWALSFRGRTIRLFFVLPISARGLLLFVIGMNVLMVIAGALNFAGHVALFAGMGAGWLFGGSTPSPARRLLLGMRLKQLQAEHDRLEVQRKNRVKRSNLRVIDGGRSKEDSSPDDKTWLN
jgi:membrane associated rhomboid family serine protease